MAFWNRSKPYSVDKPIVAFPSHVDTPFSVTLNALDFGLNYTDFPDEPSRKSYPGGHFIVKETVTVNGNTSTYYRFLPAAVVKSVVAGSETTSGGTGNGTIVIEVERAYPFTTNRDESQNFSLVQFINGKIEQVFSYHRALSLTAIDYKNKKLEFNKNYEITDSNNSTSPLTNWITSNNANPNPNPVYLIRSDYLRRILRREPGSGALPLENQTELVTQNILGIHEHALDFTDAPTLDVAVVSKAAGVYARNLPYKDPEILYAFQSTLNPRDSF